MKSVKEAMVNKREIADDKRKLEEILKKKCKKKADFEVQLEKISKIKQRKKLEKFSKIKQKVKQIKSRYKRSRADPVRNTFAINSLGALIVTSTIVYIYIAGILSLFFSEANFYFMRETMRILECISISIVSYFFGGIFSKTEKISDEDEYR